MRIALLSDTHLARFGRRLPDPLIDDLLDFPLQRIAAGRGSTHR